MEIAGGAAGELTPNVRLWHEADIKLRPLSGRYQVVSGHCASRPQQARFMKTRPKKVKPRDGCSARLMRLMGVTARNAYAPSRRGVSPCETLRQAGIAEGHLCCGSAGTYNILHFEIAARLRDRKIENIEKLQPDVIAAGNIGCMTQIAAGTAIPVVIRLS
jgi:Cysteine-rich domain